MQPVSSDIIKQVLDTIIEQAETFLRHLDNPRITTLYIGGGTPNCISLSHLDGFLSRLWQTIEPSRNKGEVRECTVESNPELITRDLLELYSDHNIGRISIGVQTTHERLLHRLGRNTSRDATLSGLELVGKMWPNDLNIDLMYGIPGQSAADTLKDISIVSAYHPHHISLYELTYEQGTRLADLKAKGALTALSDTSLLDIRKKATRCLVEKGYHHYEISNFAVPGHQCLHNRYYWMLYPYLGCGPAAVSTLPAESTPVRIENCNQVDRFLNGRPALWNSTFEYLPAKTFLFEHFLMGLRMTEGMDLLRINRIFDVDTEELLDDYFYRLQHERLLWRNAHRVGLTQKGELVMNQVLLELLEELEAVEIETVDWP